MQLLALAAVLIPSWSLSIPSWHHLQGERNWGRLTPLLLLLSFGWGIIMLFNLITLPVEFDASARAKRVLAEMGLMRTPQETEAVNKVLDAAALTYVAAFITSLSLLLYFLMMLSGGRRN